MTIKIKELLYRIDLNDDKKISYDEFQDMFFPFQKHLLFEETNEDEKYDYGIESYNDFLINYSDILCFLLLLFSVIIYSIIFLMSSINELFRLPSLSELSEFISEKS